MPHIPNQANQENVMKNLLPPNWRFDTAQLKGISTDGKWLLPPLVDLCARLREPGHQSHGTLASEGRAARQNGFLHVVMPPDTNPVLENGSLLKGLKQKAWTDGGIYLHVLGALSAGLEGKQPANLAGLKQGGAIGVSNTAAGFESDLVLLRCLEYAATFDIKVFFYPDEPSLSAGVWLTMAISHLFMDCKAFRGWLRPLHCLSKF
ncbi:Dihydroorotase [Moraxella catarrhalis]|nr:Dihydroorotase [Moraxella catarrhalis]